jgi:hypothetical protein
LTASWTRESERGKFFLSIVSIQQIEERSEKRGKEREDRQEEKRGVCFPCVFSPYFFRWILLLYMCVCACVSKRESANEWG